MMVSTKKLCDKNHTAIIYGKSTYLIVFVTQQIVAISAEVVEQILRPIGAI
jgi:hypothetical protein